jgi:hypothetical protein
MTQTLDASTDRLVGYTTVNSLEFTLVTLLAKDVNEKAA